MRARAAGYEMPEAAAVWITRARARGNSRVYGVMYTRAAGPLRLGRAGEKARGYYAVRIFATVESYE